MILRTTASVNFNNHILLGQKKVDTLHNVKWKIESAFQYKLKLFITKQWFSKKFHLNS